MKKYIALPLSAALVASAIPPQVEAASLKDIKGHPYEASIQALLNEGVITGFPDQTYKPEQALTRWDIVVLLGRYLERQGYKVPSDYKTNMRFSDLTPTSGDMLLKYAALVKDNGIFLGGNGQLLHKELLSHHHAALVLVRAMSKLGGTDFANHDEADYFVDIQNLQEQDRKAISLFAKLNLVSGQYFKPSTATTRGEFAHYLHGMRELVEQSELKVESIQVLNSSHLYVTFNDGRTHDVFLSASLVPNKKTTISFTAYGKRFVEVVEMNVDENFTVVSVTNPNAAQFAIQFSKPVQLAGNYNQLDIQKIVQLTPRDAQGVPTLIYGELSADRKTLTVTTNANYILNKRYYLQLNGVHSEDGATLDNMRESVTFTEDKTKPIFSNVEQLSLNEVLVKFSEPVSANYNRTYKLANGKQVFNITSRATVDKTGVIFDLSNARVDGKTLEKNTDVYVEFTSITDRKNNVTTNIKTTIRKSDQFIDRISPELVSIEQYGAKKIKMTFTEPMRLNNLYNVRIIANNDVSAVDLAEQDPTNPNAYILTMDNYLRGSSTVTTRRGYYVYDLADNRLTFNKQVTFNYNTAEPTVVSTEVVREDNNEYLYMYFDNAIELNWNALVAVQGTYTVNNQRLNIQTPIQATLYPVVGNPKAARVLLSELLQNIDRNDSNYSVSMEFTGVKNDYGISLKSPVVAQFYRTKDYNYNANQLEVVSVDTSRTNATIKNSSLIVVNFNYAVDIDTAMNIENYDFDDYKIEKVNVNRANPKQVELYIKPNTITSPTSEYLSIDNIRAMGSVYPMVSYYEDIYVNENVRPTLNMPISSSNSEYVTINGSNALTNSKEITLTYNEALAEVPSDMFVVKNAEGYVIDSETALHPTDRRKVVIKFEQNLPRNKAITIQFKANRVVTDMYYNEADRKSFKITIPYY